MAHKAAGVRCLENTRTQFMSLVAKAANERVFLIMKEQGLNHQHNVELCKSDGSDPDGPRFVTGIVYPPDTADTQGDAMTAEEIEKAARWYMKNARGNDIRHNGVQAGGVWLAECAVTKCAQNIGGQHVPEGTWYITVGIDNQEIRKAVRDGQLSGFPGRTHLFRASCSPA